MFFQNAFGGGGGSPSAFTSPGMNPQALAMLMAMQNRPGAGGPQLPTPPNPPPSAGAAPALQGPQMPQGDNPMQQMPNLNPMMQQLRQWLGLGQQANPSLNTMGSPNGMPW